MATDRVSNFTASLAHRHLRKTNVGLSFTLAQLSAGKRVQSAKDDAAALAIGARLGAEVSGLRQARVNAGQASSMLQVADGGLDRAAELLGRMKTLAVRAGNGALGASERGAIDREFQALSAEIGRIAEDTDFGGTALLDGSAGGITAKVGAGVDPAADDLAVALPDATRAGLGIGALDVSTRAGADAALNAIGSAMDALQTARADIGASRNRLDFAAATVATAIENTEAARSSLIDLDVAAATGNLANQKALAQSGASMLRAANDQSKAYLKLLV
jgi:flagellin